MIHRIIFVFLASVFALSAQTDANKGRIVGTIRDSPGAPIAAAKVTARNAQTGQIRTAETNPAGAYTIPVLDAGAYRVEARSEGFAPGIVSGVILNVGSSATVDVVLDIEATSTVIEVSALAIELELSAPANVVNNNAITNLPINGRRFQDFALLTPTVQVERIRQQLSFVGQRGINSNIMVDGADYNQPFFGGIRGGERSNFVPTLSQSAVQEFQAVTSGYTAEYGRSTGGMLNVITKSGSNSWRGDAFYLNRDQELGAKNPLGRTALPTQHQFGSSIGGPVMRDKLFLFGALENQRSSADRLVLFPLLDSVDASRGQEAVTHFSGLETPFQTTNNALAGTVRGDYAFENGDRLTLRYNHSRGDASNADGVGGFIDPTTTRSLESNGSEDSRTHFGTMQLINILTASTVNDLRFSGF